MDNLNRELHTEAKIESDVSTKQVTTNSYSQERPLKKDYLRQFRLNNEQYKKR